MEELEQKASVPDFWNDPENSQKILQKTKAYKTKLEKFEKLMNIYEELLLLIELGMEENDSSVIKEVESGLYKFKKDFNSLKLETLFTGPYDSGNAILTLHAGAGGTEAQDWVEMLLRMYTRWSEDKESNKNIGLFGWG